MASKTLLPFGKSGVATVHPSGIVEIRVVDDQEHRTLTNIMHVYEFARIAEIVFMNVRNDAGNTKQERERAGAVNGTIMNFIQRTGGDESGNEHCLGTGDLKG